MGVVAVVMIALSVAQRVPFCDVSHQVSRWFIFPAMKHVVLLSLVLCACTPSAFIGSGAVAPASTPSSVVPDAMVGSWHLDGSPMRSSGFYDPTTLDFAESAAPGQYIALTADGRFEEGRVTRTGAGECSVARYEYHRGTVVVRDSVLVLYATAGRVRSVAPCDLRDDYEKNDTGVRTLAWHAGQSEAGGSTLVVAAASLVRDMPAALAAR
jgi:hypothetical protein